MAKSNRSNRNDWGVLEMAREKPIAAAATAVGAAAAGLFLWSKRTQISDQLSSLNDQFAEWKQNWMTSDTEAAFTTGDDINTGTTKTTASRGRSARRHRGATATAGAQTEATPTT